ncbi:FAD-dependent monooxygenase [uncultured Maritimibacter sp.]|jgi:2,4-dichlorophenol 6-monooxygenase|uniref:FAD-dependent monooxygenase n=1 Tax=uncultured Maritimibacter sp. TaxID=991866 RepID=UPI0026321647|nr:FAD-dependent monooxygenase [uncultured Maritimibacter sp.]
MQNEKIVIVGAGPTGLAAACLLHQRGYAPIVLDQRTEPEGLPAAHVINVRTMEVLSELGAGERTMAAGDPDAFKGHINWVETLAGRKFGVFQLTAIDVDGDRPVAGIPSINIPQNKLETQIRSRLEELGGKVLYGHRVTQVTQAADKAEVTVETATGLTVIEADWVIGCDGAGSTVRRSTGIKMIGPQSLARFMTIYFRADVDHLLGSDYGVLYWICGQDVRGLFINFERTSRNWAMLVPIGDLPLETFDEAAALRIVRKAIGDETIPVDLVGLSGWNMSAQVADRYREGRVILAGDACHRFPPTGGLGLNTGVQDAQNLAWKLDAVIRGLAPVGLLDTYQQERQPIAQRNTDHSVSNLQNMAAIDEALGFHTLAPIAAEAAEGPLRAFPSAEIGVDGDSPEATAKRARVDAAIQAQAPHFSQGAEVDLDFTYRQGALSTETCDPAEPGAGGAHVGRRMPFANAGRGWDGSTLASVAREGLTVFADGPGWDAAAAAASQATGLPVTVRQLAAFGPHAVGLMQIEAGGAVGVRPDGHVSWIARHALPDPAAALITAVSDSHCLGPSGTTD